MKPILKCVVMGVSLVTLAACSTAHKRGHASGSGYEEVGGVSAGELKSQGLGESDGIYGADTRNMTTDQLLAVRRYHFAFDSDTVSAQDKPAVIAKANYLASHPEQHIILAGNTDSRGSREYNIALGWRRAQSIENMMLLNGASQAQIKLVSYGEEKPVAMGDTDRDYAQNRRVDIINEE